MTDKPEPITDEEIAEGADLAWVDENGDHWIRGNFNEIISPREWFKRLWNSINASPKPIYVRNEDGKKVIDHFISYPWSGQPDIETHRGKPHHIHPNPWVAAYTFEPIFQNVDQLGGGL